MRVIGFLLVVLLVGGALFQIIDADAVARWAAQQQRVFQSQMADAVQALRAGHPGGVAALFAAAAAYGFVHAVGPGHGKALIGGVGLGASVTAVRLLVISLLSSLAQAVWAIVLVYGGFALLSLSAQRMTGVAERILAPASYLAIALVGALLLWRGAIGAIGMMRSSEMADHHDHHPHDSCGCHAHGPSPAQLARITTWRETLALVVSIAIRPCTGAIFLLVIAWQSDLRLVGAAAVIVMGLGTAGFTSLVAISSVAARWASLASADRFRLAGQIWPGLQIVAGALILWISLTVLALVL